MIRLTVLLIATALATGARAQTFGGGGGPAPTDGGRPISAAQAAAVAQGITAFTNPNIAMPNGGHIAHLIYNSAIPVGITISGTGAQSVFSASGAGSLSMAAGAFNYGQAEFVLRASGVATTGALNVATVTDTIALGATTLVSAATSSLPASTGSVPFVSEVTCDVQAAGSAGVVSCQGTISLTTGLVGVAPLVTHLVGMPVTVDLTQALTWGVTEALSSTIGSPKLVIYHSSIWQTN